MSELLVDAYRHSAWAKQQLLEACGALSAEQLRRAAPGSVGTILSTLNHLVITDVGFIACLDGGLPPQLDEEQPNDLATLRPLVEEASDRWQSYLRGPVDAARRVRLDGGTYETDAGVVVVQALHHVSIHGEQVCAALTALGVLPPDVQPWALADATGRSRWVRPHDG